MDDRAARPRSARFLILYALANAGGVLAFLPLLTLLLPLKVEAVASDHRLGLLTIATLGGAIAASVSNIAFGHLSDRTYARHGSRKRWIAAGLVATVASYGGILAAGSAASLVGAVILFQAALNMLLAPLFATMADEVPDGQKGLAGGLLACAAPTGSIFGGLLTQIAWLGEGGRFAAVCALVVAMIVPLLLFATPAAKEGVAHEMVRPTRRGDLWLVWSARLLVQIAGNVLFTYLLFYFESVDRTRAPIAVATRAGHVTGIALLLSVPIAVGVGRLSDRAGTRKPFLLASATLTAIGLVAMARADGWAAAVAGYGAFACGLAVFLGLHSAYAMQMLPSPRHRGRDLGVLNLTNTVPALLGPALTWTLTDGADFGTTLIVLAILTAIGGVMVLATHEPVRAT